MSIDRELRNLRNRNVLKKGAFMCDVLFITQDSAYPQMGVLYLVDALRKQGIESEIIASGIGTEGLDAAIGFLNPRVVGMSVMTAPEIRDFERHSIYLKENYPDIAIVWGGVHATLLSSVCAQCNYIDYVFIGQGEERFPQLVEEIIDGKQNIPRIVNGFSPNCIDNFEPAWDKEDISKYLFSEKHSVRSPDVRVRNLVSQSAQQLDMILGKNGNTLNTSKSRSTALTATEMKKWDVGLYETESKLFYYLLTSRGCPYKCTFCSEPLQIMHGDQDDKFKWNAHSVDWFKNQIDLIKRRLSAEGTRMDGIGIWDDMFWVHHRKEPRAFEILNYLKKEGLGYLIEARADQLLRDEGSLMRTLADTGCIQVFIGAESGSQETLNYMRKGTKLKDYFHLMKLANDYQVALRMSFIIGFPNETDESVNATLDLCAAIEAGDYGPWVNVSGPKIFTPYPGTIEYTRAVERGFRPPTTNSEWSGINRSTEEYLHHFPWFENNCEKPTLKRLEGYFGRGYDSLRIH